MTFEQVRLDLLMWEDKDAKQNREAQMSNSEWLDREAKKAREEAERRRLLAPAPAPARDPELQRMLDACGDGNTDREAALRRLALMRNPPAAANASYSVGATTSPPPGVEMAPFDPRTELD